MEHVDGNALAGPLAEIFPFDITAAVGRCAHCGSTGMIGDAMVYFAAPGTIVRCANCDEVLATLIETPSRIWLTLSGVRGLHLATA
jgi:ribosomal protein S27E